MKTYLRYHLGKFVVCFMAPLLSLFLPYKFVERHVSGPWSGVFVVMAMNIMIGVASVEIGSRLDAWRQSRSEE